MFLPLSDQVIATWQGIGSWDESNLLCSDQGVQKIYVVKNHHGFIFIVEDKEGARNEILHIQGWIPPDQIVENKREQLYKMLRPLLSSDKSSVIFSIFEKSIYLNRHAKVVCFAENKGIHFQFLPSYGDPFEIENVKGLPIPTYNDLINLNSNILQFNSPTYGATFSESCLIFYDIGHTIFVTNAFSGETITIYAEMEDSIFTIKQRIKDKEGIPTNKQKLVFAARELHNDRTLSNCGIEWHSKMLLVLASSQGGSELLPFADVNKEIKLDLISEGPSWREVTLGLNLIGKCVNEQCKANNQTVCIQKGLGTFNMNKECNLATCPECHEPAAEVTNCGFYRSFFSITGRTEDGKEVSRLNIRAPDNQFLTFDTIPGAAMNQYQSLTITTTSLNSPTITQVKSPTTTRVNSHTANQPTKEQCTLFCNSSDTPPFVGGI